jgi:hypothetical protein
MVIEIKNTETFIPEWKNNGSLPLDQQVSIVYKTPDIGQRKRIVQKPAVKFEYDRDGNPTGGSGEINSDPEAAIRVVADTAIISNLSYTKGGKETPIRNVSDLLSAPCGFYGLIKEFADHLTKVCREDIPEKN